MIGILKEGIIAVLADDSFKINSSVAKSIYNVADAAMKWIKNESNKKEANFFEEKLVYLRSDCLVDSTKSKRGKITVWSNYHNIITSEDHRGLWHSFLQIIGLTGVSPMFCQFVSDHVVHELLTVHFPVINCDM